MTLNQPGDTPEAPPLAIPLCAGPLRLVFDRGQLRWIRIGGREVLHGIYAAVREAGWATVPARLESLRMSIEPDAFRIDFVARHRRGHVHLDWIAHVRGEADGRIEYSIDAVAGSTFLRNRIGFCVLHSMDEYAGHPCTVEHVSGEREPASFPRLVSPHQPLVEVRSITTEPVPGVFAEVRMEGDTFETEDQRNWSDASFKTYCTPLARPYPVEVVEGTRIRQSVTLSLHGEAARPIGAEDLAAVPGSQRKRRNGPEPVIVDLGAQPLRLPAIGVAGAGLVSLPREEAAEWRRLGLSHLRADLWLGPDGWRPALERAVANARLLSVPLELAVFVPDDPEPALRALADAAAALRAPVRCFMPFRAADSLTHAGDATLARRILGPVDPAALFAGGTDHYFAELNRSRPPVEGLDRLVYSMNPQVHAFDDATLFENLASIPSVAETARTFASGRALAISPATLRPRSDPRPAASRTPGERPFSDDERQSTVTAACWTLGLVEAVAQASVSSLTLFELEGPRGLRQDGRAFPVFEALADIAALPGAVVLPARSHRPERLQVLALRAGRHSRVFLANITGVAHPVRVEGLPGRARCAALGAAEPGEICELEHEIAPHSVLRLDVEEDA